MDKVSVVIPTLNEEGNVRALTERLHATFQAAHIGYELIFIDDHSRDRTREIVRELSLQYPITLKLKNGKGGKAYSLLEGFEYANYDLIAMIDADLQYPPEAIPAMMAKTKAGFDLVVANRADRHEGFIRNFVSKSFVFFFVRLLHGFNLDVQAGLKVFRRQIAFEINVDPTPWTFDLEFLTNARLAGYKIGSVDIVFGERTAGVSKVNLLRTSFEIGLNACKLKTRKKNPITIRPDGSAGMAGAGLAHKGRRFITHTTLNHRISAIRTFTFWQKMLFVMILGGLLWGFVIAPLGTAIALTAAMSAVYCFDVFFNLFLIMRSLRRPPEIQIASEDIQTLNDSSLPVYTILCPLYREAHVLPTFLEAIDKIDWPKDKLDVMLLLEEDDAKTLEASRYLHLPEYIRVVVVPHSMPKTKPKACNYGLSHARGEYLVIYDAEDIPDSDQLKKAYIAFSRVPENVKCLQAKLNYFNPHDNLQTRLFTAEYSLWFDVVLPGLQSINTSIPLGGTSNHFRTRDLLEFEGWDPFNVTEDCDLGVRLFKRGAKTAIIDSVTLEEANSDLKNWIRQRSRWIKGYMQTYLVHMRHPLQFIRENGVHAFIFQLNVGGKIAFMLINPILWLMTIAYFVFYAAIGPEIEALYPLPVFYMAAISAVFGNFMYFYYYMIGSAKRGHWSVIKYIYLIPFYWFMMSVAAVLATWQLFTKPYYWEKTNHGLQTKKAQKPKSEEYKTISAPAFEPVPAHSAVFASVPQRTVSVPKQVVPAPSFSIASESAFTDIPVPQPPPTPVSRRAQHFLPALWAKHILPSGGVLIFAMLVTNFVNFAFNAYLGRVLTFEQLGLVTLVNTVWYLAAVLLSSLSSTVNHKTAYLTAAQGRQTSIRFLNATFRKATILGIAFSFFWVISVPFLSVFFHIKDLHVLLFFTPVFLLGAMASTNRGFLNGNLFFASAALLLLTETLSKFTAAILFVGMGIPEYTYLVIPVSVAIGAIGALLITRKYRTAPQEGGDTKFPVRFYFSSIITGLSATVFLSLDIILVKHYLSPEIAGQYTLLALVGKMIYFFGSLPNTFMITFVSREEGFKHNPARVLYVLFGVTAVLVGIGFLLLGPFGYIVVPLLLGAKTLAILPYLRVYTLGIAFFTLANVIVVYHLARKQYFFPLISILLAGVMMLGIIFNHAGIADIVNIIFFSSLFGLATLILAHFFEFELQYAWTALRDFVGVFAPLPIPKQNPNFKRVLLFNWRDMRHKFAGGAEVYIHEMAKEWVRQGHSVTLFCGNDRKSLRHETIDGVEIVRRGGFYLVYVWAFVYYGIRFRGKFDVVVDCQNGIPFFTPLYVREPVYCLVHHIHQEVFRLSLIKPLAWFARMLERDFMPAVYRNVKFITVSQSSKKDMDGLGLGSLGIEIIPPGVDLEHLTVGEKSARPLILYLGRLKAYKSIDILIKAFKLLVAKVPDASLVIAGSGDEQGRLKRLVHTLGLENHIAFYGKVDEEMKIRLLQQAWVFVNPSFMEGWGITTIEANACGTPAVASDVPGLRDSIRNPHTGYLVPYGDYNAFASRMLTLIKDESLRREMSAQARVWAEQFNWQKTSAAFMLAIQPEKQT